MIDLTDKKVLKLTLKKEPFEPTASGEKKVEFRIKGGWIDSRLYNKDGSKRSYDYIEYRNGYGKKQPYCIVKWEGFYIETIPWCLYKYSNGFEVGIQAGTICIQNGKVVEVGNYEVKK